MTEQEIRDNKPDGATHWYYCDRLKKVIYYKKDNMWIPLYGMWVFQVLHVDAKPL